MLNTQNLENIVLKKKNKHQVPFLEMNTVVVLVNLCLVFFLLIYYYM